MLGDFCGLRRLYDFQLPLPPSRPWWKLWSKEEREPELPAIVADLRTLLDASDIRALASACGPGDGGEVLKSTTAAVLGAKKGLSSKALRNIPRAPFMSRSIPKPFSLRFPLICLRRLDWADFLAALICENVFSGRFRASDDL